MTEPSPSSRSLDALLELLRGRSVVALTGAGCSTESGIPDYRGPQGRRRERDPMRYQEFVADPEARRRYWARSAVGWPRFARARPNPGHRSLARMESAGVLRGILTQNVDGLHQDAGSRRVLDLHGSLSRVRCLECGAKEERARIQERLLRLNPGFERSGDGGTGWREGIGPTSDGEVGTAPDRDAEPAPDGDATRAPDGNATPAPDGDATPAPDSDAELAPDGDFELEAEAIRGFRVPECVRCGGVLKPDVVFFGECVPPRRVERAWSLYDEAEVLLVVGSSLAVYSGRRFVQRADREGVPVAVVNLGPSWADEVARVRVTGRSGAVLPRLARKLAAAGRRGPSAFWSSKGALGPSGGRASSSDASRSP